MNVLVTGANGFIGKNLVATLKSYQQYNILEIDKGGTPSELDQAVLQADFIFHLAGVNRPLNESEFFEGNEELTKRITNVLMAHEKNTPILFTSSIKAGDKTAYGKSKLSAEVALQRYAERNLAKVYIYRLPNVFGKWAQPHYNSAVATFCYQIARDEPIWIKDPNLLLNLVYIDDVLHQFLEILHEDCLKKSGLLTVTPVYSLTLGELANILTGFKTSRQTKEVIQTDNLLVKKLYSTYLSYLPENELSYPLIMHKDTRGSFTEFIKTSNRGQFSINCCKPGVTKGNHWHQTKIEKFLVVSGYGCVRLRSIFSHEILDYEVNGNDLKVIDIPAGYTHHIENTGETDLIVIIWCNESYDKTHPDTYPLEV